MLPFKNMNEDALDEPQVHKVAAKRALTVKLDDGGALAHLNVTDVFILLSPFRFLSNAVD